MRILKTILMAKYFEIILFHEAKTIIMRILKTILMARYFEIILFQER
jgi:hypothetical protein